MSALPITMPMRGRDGTGRCTVRSSISGLSRYPAAWLMRHRTAASEWMEPSTATRIFRVMVASAGKDSVWSSDGSGVSSSILARSVCHALGELRISRGCLALDGEGVCVELGDGLDRPHGLTVGGGGLGPVPDVE